MSTRANIVLKESYSYKDEKGKIINRSEELIFYRHSDGYPEGTLPILNKFMDWLKSGKIRNNLQQCAGWLIVLGAMEYNAIPKYEIENEYLKDTDTIEDPEDWKVGAFEPTTCIHGDIEYLYTIDLSKKELTYTEV
jgi:hypothetical protein